MSLCTRGLREQTPLLVTKKPSRFIPYGELATIPDDGRVGLKESGDVFAFYQLREGELFGTAATESRTAAQLKKAAFRAKGGRGREVPTTCREWFEQHFSADVPSTRGIK
jgi:hypothetical protein